MTAMLALALTVVAAAAVPASLRREPRLRFVADDAFQRRGGVQYFYELSVRSGARGETFAFFRPLDVKRLRERGDFHAVLSRVSHTVEKDISFFTRARSLDVAFMNEVVPEGGIRQLGPDTFFASKLPSNSFQILYFDAATPPDDSAVRVGAAEVQALAGLAAPPAVLVLQHNDEFARLWGVKTAEGSVTWTAHVPLGKGRTRLEVLTLSYLHHTPPFFLGGEDRIHAEATAALKQVVEKLRAYPGG